VSTRLRLIDVERAERAPVSKCRALVPRDRDECPRCRAPLATESIVEMALFLHSGYGANRETTFAVCTNRRYRSVRVVRIEQSNPRVPDHQETN